MGFLFSTINTKTYYYCVYPMKLSEILYEDAAAGATGGAAIAGFQGSLFGKAPVSRLNRKRYKVKKLTFKNTLSKG